MPGRVLSGPPAADAYHDAVDEIGEQHRRRDRATAEGERGVHDVEQQPPLIDQQALIAGRLAPVAAGDQRDGEQPESAAKSDGCGGEHQGDNRIKPGVSQPAGQNAAPGQRDSRGYRRRRQEGAYGPQGAGGHREDDQCGHEGVDPPADRPLRAHLSRCRR